MVFINPVIELANGVDLLAFVFEVVDFVAELGLEADTVPSSLLDIPLVFVLEVDVIGDGSRGFLILENEVIHLSCVLLF